MILVNARHLLVGVTSVRCASLLEAASVLFVNAAWAVPEECRDAVDSCNSAISDLSDALHRYSSCLGGSNGRDDCSIEFSALRSAQDDFESAVSSYETECN